MTTNDFADGFWDVMHFKWIYYSHQFFFNYQILLILKYPPYKSTTIKRFIQPNKILQSMTEKYQNKYRIASARLQSWDYANEGAYFITICTKDRRHYFGAVKNGKMVLSNAGVIANLMWYEIKNHGKNVELGEFVVMPNHVHGILILNDINPSRNIETGHALSLSPSAAPIKSPGQQRFQNQGKSTISSITGSYKSAVTKHCNRLGFEFGWQTRFYDHIIRDGRAFENISNYIVNNPEKWDIDKFYANE